ncbi:MAG: hypothetical protein Greene041619_711 [Candidatus Peregrinibacteria bacterium Greene0416_19]|nr:MAG: hypothetical protein Greene041619_711 [Candidatus Peregrinibacteria bacterium Greene0416_19]
MTERSPADGVERIPHMLLVSQVVRDIKVGGGRHRESLARRIGVLRAGLIKRLYIPADKLNAIFRPQHLSDDGVLTLDIFGGDLKDSDLQSRLDTHFLHEIPLDLRDPAGITDVTRMQLQDLLMRCHDVAVDDGGNAQNMAVNVCLAGLAALRNRLRVTIFSSSDPFKRLPGSFPSECAELFRYVPLENVPDRIAIQVPWLYENGESGTFALTTDAADLTDVVQGMVQERRELRQLFLDTDCFVASDPSFELARFFGKPGRHTTIVNPATRWRSFIANRAFGTDVILPMNNKEAADVTHVIQHVGEEKEMYKVPRPPFPSPLRPNGNEIDQDQLRQLDKSLWMLSRHNHPHHRVDGLVAFDYPITFEADGGLVVGTRDRDHIAAFTSTVDPDKEKTLIEEFGKPEEVDLGRLQTMGAGDAAASIVAIFNTIDPQSLIEPYLEGRLKTNAFFRHVAQTVFVSALSRIVGNFLVRTKRCQWLNVDHEKIADLFQAVAKESCAATHNIYGKMNPYSFTELPRWGIKLVTWNLGTISHPHTDETAV